MIARNRSMKDPSWMKEESWWRENFQNRPYVNTDRGFDFYEPAFRYGYESATHFVGREWDEVEPELRRNWDRWEHRGESNWEQVKESVKDAFHHAARRRSD